MKIATIYTLYGRRAGAELFFEKIIFGMLETFSDITFTVYCNDEAFSQLPDSTPRLLKIAIKQLNNQFSKAFWLEFVSANVITSEKFDLFWIPSGTNSFPGRWEVPNVVTFLDFGEYHVKNKYDLKRTIFRKMICIPRAVRRGTVFSTISKTTSEDLRRLFKKDSITIYPGPSPKNETEPFSDPRQVVQAECSVALQRIIYVPGRTDFIGKGLDVLLAAYRKILAYNPDFPLLVLSGPAGEGHEMLLDAIMEPGLEGRVLWLGRVSDRCVNALYSFCEMVVIPSRYEGFGFPVLEAMERGAPLICSDGGSLPEVAGTAALITKAGDSDGLAKAMVSLYNNSELRNKLKQAGVEQLLCFSWDKTYAEMYRLFLSVIDEKGRTTKELN